MLPEWMLPDNAFSYADYKSQREELKRAMATIESREIMNEEETLP